MRRTAVALFIGAALGGGILIAPAASAAAETCPAEVAEFVVFASPRAVIKYLDSTLVHTSTVNGKLQCHFVGTGYGAVPGRPPIITPNVEWSRPASVFK